MKLNIKYESDFLKYKIGFMQKKSIIDINNCSMTMNLR